MEELKNTIAKIFKNSIPDDVTYILKIFKQHGPNNYLFRHTVIKDGITYSGFKIPDDIEKMIKGFENKLDKPDIKELAIETVAFYEEVILILQKGQSIKIEKVLPDIQLPEELKPFAHGLTVTLPEEWFVKIISGAFVGVKGWEAFEEQDSIMHDKPNIRFPKLDFIIENDLFLFENELLSYGPPIVNIENILFKGTIVIDGFTAHYIWCSNCTFENKFEIKNFTAAGLLSSFSLSGCLLKEETTIANGTFERVNISSSIAKNISFRGGVFKDQLSIDYSTIEILSIADGSFKEVLIGQSNRTKNTINELHITGGNFLGKFMTDNLNMSGKFIISDGVFEDMHICYGIQHNDFVIEGGTFNGLIDICAGIYKKDFIICGGNFNHYIDFMIKKVEGALKIIDCNVASGINITNSTLFSNININNATLSYLNFHSGKVLDGIFEINNSTFEHLYAGTNFLAQKLHIKNSLFNEWSVAFFGKETNELFVYNSQFKEGFDFGWAILDVIISGSKFDTHLKVDGIINNLKLENNSINLLCFGKKAQLVNMPQSIGNTILQPVISESDSFRIPEIFKF